MRVKKKDIYIFMSILLLTLSHCVAYVGTRMEAIFEYSGYLLLLGGILHSYFRIKRKYRKDNTSKAVIISLILLSTGILLQNLSISRKMTLLFTVVAIVIVALMSENFLGSYKEFRVMAYACLTGVLLSIILCLIHNVALIRYTSEATFGFIYFFNGGIRDKNVATMMIVVIISLYIYSKENGGYKTADIVTIFICIIVLISSNSRGAWIEFIVFLLMLNYKLIGKIYRTHRVFFLVMLLIAISPIAINFYNNFVMKSETYLLRYRGLTNYISKFSDDTFHMLFGNAEMAYRPGVDYAYAVRSVTGWNGTIENSWLNILIKSGLLGVIAYIIIFVRAIITAKKCNNILYKTIYLSVIVAMIFSSFVAIYIQTIHGLFGIYCYLIMAYYSGIIRENKYYRYSKPLIDIRQRLIAK